MSPTRPPTFGEKYRGGRAATDKAYNAARKHDPMEQVLHTARWQKFRDYILRRDKHSCQLCHLYRNAKYPNQATQVHHIRPRSTHPELCFDERNAVSVCPPCHAKADAERRSE